MKMTMRDKICVLIGKYKEKEQQELVKTVVFGVSAMLGDGKDKVASAKANAYHWIQEDLKKLLEEDDDSKPEGCCKCHIDGKKEAKNDVDERKPDDGSGGVHGSVPGK